METSKTGFVATKPILTNLPILHTRIRNNDLVLCKCAKSQYAVFRNIIQVNAGRD